MNHKIQPHEAGQVAKRKLFDDEDFRVLKNGFYAVIGSAAGMAVIKALVVGAGLLGACLAARSGSNNGGNSDR